MNKNKGLVLGACLLVIALMFVVGKGGETLKDLGQKIVGQAAVITANPPAYEWYLDNSLSPHVGSANFPAPGTYTLSATGGAVGGALETVTSGAVPPAIALTQSQTAVTVEMMFKAGQRATTGFLFSSLNGNTNADLFSAKFIVPETSQYGVFYPEFIFTTTNNAGVKDHLGVGLPYTDPWNTRTVLNGINQANLSTYFDGNWHHLAFVYDAAAGTKKIMFDGSVVATKSGLGSSSITIGNLYFGDVVRSNLDYTGWDTSCDPNWLSERRCSFSGSYDEVAIYTNQAVNDAVLHEHYRDVTTGSTKSSCGTGGIYSGHYCSGTTYTTSDIPAAPAMTAAIRAEDFVAGYPNIPTSSTLTNQLKGYAIPRYKPANTLLGILNWADLTYASGWKQPGVTDAQMDATAVPIATELSKNFNYALPIIWSSNTPLNDAIVTLALQNPSWHTSTTTLRVQVPGGTALHNQGFSSEHYLQDSSGNFILENGIKQWRPWPNNVADYATDGNGVKNYFLGSSLYDVLWNGQSFASSGRSIEILNEDGEVFSEGPGGNVLAQANSVIPNDPGVVAAKNALCPSNSCTWSEYLAKQKVKNETEAYFNVFKTLPFFANTLFTEYKMSGGDYNQDYVFNYKEVRKMLTQKNGQYYASPDMYSRWPKGWMYGVTAWHGLDYIQTSVKNQVAAGDNLFMPFGSPGYMSKEVNPLVTKNYAEEDIRPGQWLGLLKLELGLGAETYATTYFNEAGNYNGCVTSTPPCPADPKTYAWQYPMASYSQALGSRVESFLRNSLPMTGQSGAPGYSSNSDIMPLHLYSNDTLKKDGYLFAIGDPNKVAVVRKQNGGVNNYLITTSFQVNHNMNSPADERVANVTATIDGTKVSFETRRQGAVYRYDNTNSAAPVFYQLDKWQEDQDPSRWSPNFAIEAEVYDCVTNCTAPNSATTPIKTEGPGVATRNFTPGNYDSYIDPVGTVIYKFQPRDAATNSTKNYILWYRGRSNTGAAVTGTFKVDAGAVQTASVSSSTFTWCKLTNTFPVVANSDHDLVFTGSNSNFDLDQILLTTDASVNLGNCTSGGGTNTAPTTPGAPTVSAITQTSANLSWAASADDVAVAGYYIYNGANQIGNSIGTGTTYSLTGLTASTAYSITVKAYDGPGLLSAASTPATAFTTLAVPDTTGPVVTITSPTNGQGVSGTVNIQATITDAGLGVAYVDFYAKKGTAAEAIVCSDSTATGNVYSCSWNSTTGTDGSYNIYARAYDLATPTNITVSSTTAIAVTVTNVVVLPDTTGPTMGAISMHDTITGGTLTSPYSGSIGFWITAQDLVGTNGAAAAGMQKVEFYRGTSSSSISTLIDTDTTAGGVMPADTFAVTLNTTGLANGTYYIQAKGYDLYNPSNTTLSASIQITVSNVVVGLPDLRVTAVSWTPTTVNAGSQVLFAATVKNFGTGPTPTGIIPTGPLAGQTYKVGVLFTINGINMWSDTYTSALAPNQSITLYANGGSTSSYWTSTAGTPVMTAYVDDVNRMAETIETNNTKTANVTVNSTGMYINMTTPTNYQSVSYGQVVPMQSVSSGSIYRVRYLRGTATICNSTTPPAFACNWTVGSTTPATLNITPVGYNSSDVEIVRGATTQIKRN